MLSIPCGCYCTYVMDVATRKPVRWFLFDCESNVLTEGGY